MDLKPPDEAKLYDAAINHLARYAATEAGLVRTLSLKIDRWAKMHATDEADTATISAAVRTAKSHIPRIIGRLKSSNILNDDAFAASRAKRLTREGKSRIGTLAHLAAKGVAPATAASVLTNDPERELAAACAFLRRRRAGPFGNTPELKILGAMARAGFSQDAARQALQLDRTEAEDRIKSIDDSFSG